MILKTKEQLVNKILEDIRDKKDSDKDAVATPGLFYGYVKAILDNMKIKLQNIHLKIEDIDTSVKNKTFSFGICCDLLEYSYVTK